MLRDEAHLLDMLNFCRKLVRYTANKEIDDYYDDEILRDAVERNMSNLGEAARRVSDSFRADHPEIPWRDIIAERNVMVHEYDAIDWDDTWEVATTEVPTLIQLLETIIKQESQSSGQ